MVRHRKNTPTVPASASDPLAFLEKLSPVQIDRVDEDALARAAERERRDQARKAYGIAIPDEPESDEWQVALDNVKRQNKRVDKRVDERVKRAAKRALEKRDKERRRLREEPSIIPSLRKLRAQISITQAKAAELLGCTTRTIRNRTKAKKLTLTPAKRIIIDDKFAQLYRKVHGDGVLHY